MSLNCNCCFSPVVDGTGLIYTVIIEYKLRLHPNSEASFRYFSWFYGVYGGVSGTWRGRAVLVKLRYS